MLTHQGHHGIKCYSMPQPTKAFIRKVETNRRKLRRLDRIHINEYDPYRKAKVIHSLIHNMVEAWDNHGRTNAGQDIISEIRSDILEYL